MTVVNFNKAKKAKARADKTARAAKNAVKFGRSKAEKQRDQTTNDALKAHVDQHKQETLFDTEPKR